MRGKRVCSALKSFGLVSTERIRDTTATVAQAAHFGPHPDGYPKELEFRVKSTGICFAAIQGMDRLHRVTLFGLLVLTPLSSFHSTANADGLPESRLALVTDHSEDPVLGVVGSGTVQYVETPTPPVPRECTPRYMAGPAVGAVVGPGAIVAGMFMVGAGSVDPFDTHQKTRRDRGLIAGGSITMAAGLGTFLYSIAKLVKNRHERQRVCYPDVPQSH